MLTVYYHDRFQIALKCAAVIIARLRNQNLHVLLEVYHFV